MSDNRDKQENSPYRIEERISEDGSRIEEWIWDWDSDKEAVECICPKCKMPLIIPKEMLGKESEDLDEHDGTCPTGCKDANGKRVLLIARVFGASTKKGLENLAKENKEREERFKDRESSDD